MMRSFRCCYSQEEGVDEDVPMIVQPPSSSSVGGAGADYDALKEIQPKASPEVQARAVKDLIGRLLPERAHEFEVLIEPSLPEEENGYFQITKGRGDGDDTSVVLVKGSTGVLASWGFHYYLTQCCRCHVSWDADQLNLPAILPQASVRIASLDRFRYYQNVCTESYSFVWWQWPRWEREIDWMALNGINLPLAFTGQEAIWQRVYLGLGLKQADIDKHFTGPAYFAWLRMSNIRGWGGPLSENWQSSSLQLQHQILDRMRSFGMIPVLPAFAGHLPRPMKKVYPKVPFMNFTPWMGMDKHVDKEYCCPIFLPPTDPLFQEIGVRFLQEMISEFGTDHVYNCDVFNEVRPTLSDPTSFVSSVGRAVFETMKESDPGAIWMMQGWMFIYERHFWSAGLTKALLTSVPLGRMLVLDLQAELNPQYLRFESFHGQPFIFCLLQNFGGTLGLYGPISRLAKVIEARNFPNSTMVGTGLTMEGIDQNYVVYDHMLEMGWRSQLFDLNRWFDEYTVRRYGVRNSSAIKAWRLLQGSVYKNEDGEPFHGRVPLTSRPSIRYMQRKGKYNPHDVILAWDELIRASADPILSGSANFQHDLIDVTRQSIQEMFHLFYDLLIMAYSYKNLTSLGGSAKKLLNLLDDLDSLLQTGHKFLLGKWLNDAKSRGITEEEKLLYEWNARTQITTWGPRRRLGDYAVKQWAGIVMDYFKPRWSLFLRQLEIALKTGREFDPSACDEDIFTTIEKPFTLSTKLYSASPQGSAVSTAVAIHEKWRSVYESERKSSKFFP